MKIKNLGSFLKRLSWSQENSKKDAGLTPRAFFVSKKIRYPAIFLIAALLIFIGLVNFYPQIIFRQPENNSGSNYKNEEGFCQNCVRRNLDGVYVKAGEENKYPIGVIIDNHPDARPAYGISQAVLVYEAEAEGGITRYLAFFPGGEKVDKIGPVRSARPYFLDWIKELSAVFVHVGGSPEALVKIAQTGIFDLNEFYNGSYFWRVNNRTAPHNVFTSPDNISKYLELKKLESGNFFLWRFKADNPSGQEQKEIKINFKAPDFTVGWKYDKIKNEYTRYLANKLDQDASNQKEIKAKNIIIQILDTKVLDDELRLRINTLGSGKATICLDGRCEEGIWKKTTASARTRYYYNSGSEVEFNAGKTWVETVKPGLKIDY